MSIDEAGSGKPLETEATEKKGTRSRPAPVVKVRSYRSDTVYRQDLPKYLNKSFVDGYVIEFILQAIDIRGFEVVSYKEV